MKYNRVVISSTESQKGTAMIVSLFILAMVAVIGIFSIKSSIMESRISANDTLFKKAFYAADGGTETAIELIEFCIDEAGIEPESNGIKFIIGDMAGMSPNLYMNTTPSDLAPSDTNRDAWMPAAYSDGEPHTNLRIGGDPFLTPGSAIQMAAGYEGLGLGAAGGGTLIRYRIGSEHVGTRRSTAAVGLIWRHLNM